jgi:D-amino peptidase
VVSCWFKLTDNRRFTVRIVIISDMEGVSGIVRWEQVNAGKPMFEEGRALYTADINAAISGAYDGGATEVIVMDWHGAGGGYSFNSLIPEMLDPRCSYVVQERVPQYTAVFEDGCDAAFLVGMHARAGTAQGVLNHTVFGSSWQNLWFNGTLFGETGVNAALCGAWDCPVVLITGDDVTCAQGQELLGQDVLAVAVKKGIGRSSAVLIPPLRARELIEGGVREAMGRIGSVKPYDPGKPCEIVVEFTTTSAFDDYRTRPGAEVVGERRVKFEGPDWWRAWSALMHSSVYRESGGG